MMSPYKIEVLLWYHTHGVADHPDMLGNSCGWRTAIDELKLDEFIEHRTGPKTPVYATVYQLAPRGRVYLAALLALPFPVRTWTMPS